jgi:hypothetical protein
MTAPSAWTGTPPPASSSVWRGVPGSRRRSHRTRCATGSSPPPRCRRRPARRSRSRLTRRPENDDALRQSETISRSARYLHSRHLRRRRQPPRNSAWRHQPNKWRLPPHLLVVGTIRISTSECTYCRPVSLVCPKTFAACLHTPWHPQRAPNLGERRTCIIRSQETVPKDLGITMRSSTHERTRPPNRSSPRRHRHNCTWAGVAAGRLVLVAIIEM